MQQGVDRKYEGRCNEKISTFAAWLKNIKDMAQIAGIKIERTPTGVPRFVTIDLQKHADMISVLEQKGLNMEKSVKWSTKMKKSFAEATSGEIYTRNLEDLLNV